MTAPVAYWYEFASTYSYPATWRIAAAAEAADVALLWRPFLLGPLMREQGLTDSPFNLFPVKGRYMWDDVARLCAAQGLAWQKPATFPRNGLLAARTALLGQDEAWCGAFSRAVYAANFADDRDISNAEVIAAILSALGLDAAALLAAAQAPENKQRLAEQTAQAGRLGIFGAPTLVVGDELFWGGDRIDAALERARAMEINP